MTFLGNIGFTLRRSASLTMQGRKTLAEAVQPTGNGPITNASAGAAAAFATVKVVDTLGGLQDVVAKCDATGIWSVVDVPPGEFFATEVGASRQWLITVLDDLSFTVTPVTDSFPVNASSISIG
jgi:hypothetical protein